MFAQPDSPNPAAVTRLVDSPRLLPFAIAIVVCVLTAMVLASGLWYFFGDSRGAGQKEVAELTRPPVEQAPVPVMAPARKTVTAPAGELPVAGGVVTLGGDESEGPTRKIVVEAFSIGETEVTNEQYREFVQATGRKAPASMKDGEYRPGTASEPVTMVTWQDAVDYCRWLSQKIEATVRLPTEAEWELAARGPGNVKYPWGNEWQDRAAACKERKGQVRPVKSYPAGRSPCGAYDMAGNVWEWVSDEARDGEGKFIERGGERLRVAKGGAANEPMAFISASARSQLPPAVPRKFLGFRYVVTREKEGHAAP
jgi:formylglycine-generating enzyme required for sulfatase activity